LKEPEAQAKRISIGLYAAITVQDCIETRIIIKYKVCCVASMGIAGLLLPGGQTAHYFFAVPLDATLGSKLGASSEQARLLRDT
jgi:hypothetical protein